MAVLVRPFSLAKVAPMSSSVQSPSSAAAATTGQLSREPAARRGFLARIVALILGTVLYVPGLIAGIWACLHPLRQKAAQGRTVRLANLDALPADGVPQKFPIIADRTDAWTHYPPAPIGQVFVRRTGPTSAEAIQVVCPHAGCFVAYEPDKKIFFCPCHAASFQLGGERIDANSPSPRDLDQLEVEIRNGEVWVKFEKFRTGIPQKIVEA